MHNRFSFRLTLSFSGKDIPQEQQKDGKIAHPEDYVERFEQPEDEQNE